MSIERIKRVSELLKQEISKLLEEAKGESLDEGLFFTVVDAEVTNDLHFATIWISVIGDENWAKEFLLKITPEIQKTINKKITLKYVPKITFRFDRSAKHFQKIEDILIKVKQEKRGNKDG